MKLSYINAYIGELQNYIKVYKRICQSLLDKFSRFCDEVWREGGGSKRARKRVTSCHYTHFEGISCVYLRATRGSRCITYESYVAEGPWLKQKVPQSDDGILKYHLCNFLMRFWHYDLSKIILLKFIVN